MIAPSGLDVGFAFKAKAKDGTSLFIVNVCGHDSVGFPLARNMNEVDQDYIQRYGVDNLIIPISVSEPKKTKDPDYSYCIDVVVHTFLVQMCVKGSHLYEHLIEKLSCLAIEWIQKECGVQLILSSCQLMGNPLYYSEVLPGERAIEDMLHMAQKLFTAGQKTSGAPPEADNIPDELRLNNEKASKKKPVIQEVISTPGMKKGFLSNGGVQLYGPEGTIEGSGKAPDPLAHIPESLLKRCQVIDTRGMEGGATGSGIANIESAPTSAAATTEESCFDSTKDANRPLEWPVMSMVRADNKIIVRFSAPNGTASLSDACLSISNNCIELNGYETKVPEKLDPDNVQAKFVKSTRTLVVTCQTML